MAWYGYVTYDGTEIINVDRTEAYIDSLNATWGLKERYGTGAMQTILDTTYQSPLVDDAPWTDPDRQESYDFWGVYPLNIEGLEDSTRESVVTEYIRDGGNAGRLRHATKSTVFAAALIGANDAATEYGFSWLKAALLGRACAPNATGRCFGRDLTYFSSEPVIDPDAPDFPGHTDPVLAVLDGGFDVDDRDQQIVLDTFERNDASTLGNAETGQEWVYSTFGSGVAGFGIEDGEAKVNTAAAGSQYSFATIDSGRTVYVLEGVFAEVASDLFSGFVIRHDPGSPQSGLVVDRDDIYVGPAFSPSILDFSTSFSTGDRIRIFDDGNNLRIDQQVGGVGAWTTVGTGTSTAFAGNTHHGLAGWSDEAAPARWNDFRIMADDFSTTVVDGGTPTTTFGGVSFDGGTPSTVFPIELSEPYPEPFEANPTIPNSDPTGCLTNLQRHLKDVQVNQGPTITAKRYLSDGTVIWTIQFTAVAGDPFEYGRERVVVDGFLDGEVIDPFGDDVDGPYDSVGYALTDEACPPATWEPVYDPLCPALVAPPGPVDIPAGCFEAVDEWWRRYLSIPDDFVPLWGQSVPIIGVLAQFDDLRQVRLRLYADQTGEGDPEADQCAVIGDLMISYVPQGMTLIIDGARQSVYVRDLDGVYRRADSLVFSSDGKPIVWPELTCGYGYLMTVDTLDAGVVPAVDLSVVAKVP